MSSNTSDNEVFEYTGNGQRVPKNVVSVRFHPSVVEVDDEAFQLCKLLKTVVLNEGLVKIGRCAFRGCKSLESITLPSTVTLISNAAFQSCGELRKVVLNDGLKKIQGQAFELCKLQSITIPSSVVEFGWHAFVRCSSLNQVVLNEGLKTIGMQAFNECTSLERITLPSSVKEIGSFAFYQCINLREVVFSGELPKIEHNTFDRCSTLERITFPNLSSRLEDIIQAGQVDVQNKIQQCINQSEIEWERGDTIHIPVVAMRRRSRWDLVQQHFSQIINWIKYYEVKEATTLFELALWKAKIDQVEDIYTSDRDACRVDVPGPVKDNILHYLIGRHCRVEVQGRPSFIVIN